MPESRRPPGRPPLQRGEVSVNVCVRLPASQFDALDRRARLEHANVPELIRRRLAAGDDDDGEEDDE
jgi:hypothetical protein